MNQTNILDDPDFAEFLDVRCPTADADLLALLKASISEVTKIEVDVSNKKFMAVSLYEGNRFVNAGWRDYS